MKELTTNQLADLKIEQLDEIRRELEFVIQESESDVRFEADFNLKAKQQYLVDVKAVLQHKLTSQK